MILSGLFFSISFKYDFIILKLSSVFWVLLSTMLTQGGQLCSKTSNSGLYFFNSFPYAPDFIVASVANTPIFLKPILAITFPADWIIGYILNLYLSFNSSYVFAEVVLHAIITAFTLFVSRYENISSAIFSNSDFFFSP